MFLFQSNSNCDYIVFDIETSCLSSREAEIIELSAIKVKGTKIVDTFDHLIKPQGPLDPRSIEVHHITDSLLKNQPTINVILPKFLKFIGKNKLIGYNIASYDIPVVRRIAESLGYSFNNDYIDVLHIAQRKMNFLPKVSLSNVAAYFLIDTSGSHRALRDCEITKSCYEKLLDFTPSEIATTIDSSKKRHIYNTSQTKALQELNSLLQGIISDQVLTDDEVFSLNNWLNNNKYLDGQFPYDRISTVVASSLEDGILEQSELDEMLQLFNDFISPSADSVSNINIAGKAVCLTGNFKFGEKADVEKLISEHGGIVRKSVSGKTDYLVVGSLGSIDWSCGNYGTKIKKAKEIQLSGGKVKIISEEDFFNSFSE